MASGLQRQVSRRRRRAALAGLLAALCSAAAGVDAQPLDSLPNAGFDADLEGWSPAGAGVWSPDDAGGDPSSGSALLLAAGPPPQARGVHACLPVVPERRYAFGGQVQLALPAGVTGSVALRLDFFADAACAEPTAGSVALSVALATPWQPVASTAVSASDAASARLELRTTKFSGPFPAAVAGGFDDPFVELVPESAAALGQGAALALLLAADRLRRRPVSGYPRRP